MLTLIVAELEQAFHEIVWDDDLSYFAYHSGKAGGIAAATRTDGVHSLSLCDDISEAYESIVALASDLETLENQQVSDDADDDLDEIAFSIQNLETNFFYIVTKLTDRLESGRETETDRFAPNIGWSEYEAALKEAVRAKEADDQLRYALMIGFVSGLMFNNPGPTHPEHGTILDAVNRAYTTRSDDALKYAQARIAASVPVTDPIPFRSEEQYDRYMAEKLPVLRWVHNLACILPAPWNESMGTPNSAAIDCEIRQMTHYEQSENPPRPIEMCYWVVPGKLLAGEYPRNLDETSSHEKLAKLTDAGVSVFIDLTNPDTTDGHLKPYSYLLDGPTHERFPIDDQDVPASVELTKAALDAIDGHLAAGRTVYVHCWGGVGRTGHYHRLLAGAAPRTRPGGIGPAQGTVAGKSKV